MSDTSGDIITPYDEAGVADAVRAARAERKSLEIAGRGTLRSLGRPVQTARTLDLSQLAGVTLYEPEELVLSARPGTARAEIEEMLAARGQMLAFEPADLGPLLGGDAGAGTFGGMFCVNLSGPRRISHGAVRDHALGARAVSGQGEIFKSGGRVVKNVTGYDLPRLLCGAFGTLAVITEITLKVLPRPATQESVLVAGLSPARAGEAMSAAMGSSCEVSGAAFLPADVAARVPGLAGAADAVVFRLEGVAPSVTARRAMLLKVLAPFGAGAVIAEEASVALWRAVRDAAPFWGTGGRAVWRISTTPTGGPLLGAALSRALGAQTYCDWAGGLVWACLPGAESHADAVRAALAPFGGHATLIRAEAAERARVPVFQPQAPTLAALSGRVKESFDPARVLNPGRMHAGV
ncbi:glycolate oxidase subunit GlcE [Xanthobacter sp. KR7-225]|uniref:glycolate oxidase subunit GlcE n=1 Tax=Xanthobacter sp. KR7-225 TaxID=3156613 RepID=UPI0032B551B3